MQDQNKGLEIKLKGKFFDENEYPEEDQLVMVQCISCEENGCYVELLQYENKKGMIPINQFSKSMKKSIQRAMKIGKVQAVRVIRVDSQKGYIDLSKNKVNVEQQNIAQDKFAKSKAVHSILMHVAKHCKVDLKDLYESIVRPLYKNQSNAHPLEQLKSLMIKQDKINELKIQNQSVKKTLLDEIKRRFKRPVIKTMSVFKVSVRTFDGINHIKEILTKGVKESKDKGFDVKVTILGAPDYLCEVTTASKEEGEQAIMIALNAIKGATEQVQGDFEIKEKPKVVGDKDTKIQELYVAQEVIHDNENEDSDMGQAEDDDLM